MQQLISVVRNTESYLHNFPYVQLGSSQNILQRELIIFFDQNLFEYAWNP